METTSIWVKYQKGKEFINKKALIQNTQKNWNFYLGNQWEGLESGGEKMPMFNFIKGIVKYKVAVISQNKMAARYIDPESRPEYKGICEALNKNFEKLWENGKFDVKSWNTVKCSAVSADAYLLWGNSDATDTQVLPNVNVLLGDEQQPDIQKQPYILIIERLRVGEIKKMAKENGLSQEKIDLIVPDEEKELVIGDKTEVQSPDDEKCLSILYMDKDENGYVRVGRATKTVEYEPVEPLTRKNQKGETTGGLKVYPIVNFIWEDEPNSARGIGEVQQLIPNQLELNKTLARRSITVKQTAYPRIAYDRSMVENEEDINKIGAAIALNGGGAQSVSQMISYLNATSMSADAQYLSNDLLEITRDLAGAGDAATGNVDPEKASGEAINAVKDAAQMPLNEQVAKYSQFVTDIAYIALNLWFAYNKDITVSYEDDFGQQQEVTITQEDIDNLQPNIKIDVSSDSPWSKQAEQQEIKELFMQGHITLEEYTELMPDNSYIPKAKLKIILDKRKNQMMNQMPMGQIPMEQMEQMPAEPDDDEEAAAIDEMALQMMESELDDEEEAAAIDERAMQMMESEGLVDENGELSDGALDEDALVDKLLAEAEAAEWQNSRSVNKELKEILDKCLEEGLIDKEDYEKALQNGLSKEEIEYLKSLLS